VVPTTSGGLLSEVVYRRALEVGRDAAGVSGPNPPVGCVIVRDGVVVAEGSTSAVGGPHAEVRALAAAGDAARGAIAVVTLEPCTHHGRTPPCADALVQAGIVEVHVLHRDPDPAASGGISRLRELGMRVVEVGQALPELHALATHDLRGFLSRVRAGRPHVTLKLAQTPDGRTAPPPGGYLTGVAARTHVHALRADSDAVLVGSGTIHTDDPRLDVRHVTAARAPRPVILATLGTIAPTSRALREGTIVVLGPDAPAGVRRELERAGAAVRTVRHAAGPGPARLDLAEALTALLAEPVLTVLAEPGPRLAAALLEGGHVDTIELHVAGGSDAAGAILPAFPALSGVVEVAARDGWATADGDLIVRVDTVARSSGLPLGEVA
jgi:diaminohydroxyphosphoribosylaminopyrimidine deaminase / 5-amino-6-(5-phosphoribosylamino)uracil reductase